VIPKPVWVWKSTWGGAPIKAEYIRTSQHKKLQKLNFQGPGWYPEHRILILEIGVDEFEVSAWDCDPFQAWEQLNKEIHK